MCENELWDSVRTDRKSILFSRSAKAKTRSALFEIEPKATPSSTTLPTEYSKQTTTVGAGDSSTAPDEGRHSVLPLEGALKDVLFDIS